MDHIENTIDATAHEMNDDLSVVRKRIYSMDVYSSNTCTKEEMSVVFCCCMIH